MHGQTLPMNKSNPCMKNGIKIQATNHHNTPMNYHMINRIDDGFTFVIQLPQQLNNMYKAPAQDWGKTIEKLVRISVLAIVFVGVVTLDAATFMYRAGYALGQSIHQLNNALTQVVVRKSTQTQQVIDPWQLQLPFPKLNNFVLGSNVTTATSSTKENLPLSLCMKTGLATEDQRKEDGTTNAAIPSKGFASSPRSRRSVPQFSYNKKQSRSMEIN